LCILVVLVGSQFEGKLTPDAREHLQELGGSIGTVAARVALYDRFKKKD
jgi:hypothetical protein